MCFEMDLCDACTCYALVHISEWSWRAQVVFLSDDTKLENALQECSVCTSACSDQPACGTNLGLVKALTSEMCVLCHNCPTLQFCS